MKFVRLALRLGLLSSHIVVGVLLCLTALSRRADAPLNWRQHAIVSWWLRACSRFAGLRIRLEGAPAIRCGCFIANHISWLDILVIGGLHPVCFLSKSEIEKWPVIGYLAKKAGTLFINRGVGASNACSSITSRLAQNSSVALFPEGSTSAGHETQRFHPRLFGAAIAAAAPVQPIALAYPLNGARNPEIPFKNKQGFISNALHILQQPRTEVVVRYIAPLREDNRRQFAERTHELIVMELAKIYA